MHLWVQLQNTVSLYDGSWDFCFLNFFLIYFHFFWFLHVVVFGVHFQFSVFEIKKIYGSLDVVNQNIISTRQIRLHRFIEFSTFFLIYSDTIQSAN